jgi:hypothetical protein
MGCVGANNASGRDKGCKCEESDQANGLVNDVLERLAVMEVSQDQGAGHWFISRLHFANAICLASQRWYS